MNRTSAIEIMHSIQFRPITKNAGTGFSLSDIPESQDSIELLNNNPHGLSPPGGFVSLLCDQGLHFALCQALWM